MTLFNNPRLMTTTNKQAAEEFRRQVCIGNIHEIVTEEQVQQYFESYAGSGELIMSETKSQIKLKILVERVEFHELRAGKNTSMDKDDLGHQVRYATLVFKDSSSLGPALQLDGQVRPRTERITFSITKTYFDYFRCLQAYQLSSSIQSTRI